MSARMMSVVSMAKLGSRLLLGTGVALVLGVAGISCGGQNATEETDNLERIQAPLLEGLRISTDPSPDSEPPS